MTNALSSSLFSTPWARSHPRTVSAFASLPDGEHWFSRLLAVERGFWNEPALLPVSPREDPSLPVQDQVDLIYAGGTLGLLHAAVMAQVYHRRVLVFDRFPIGCTHREWNISRKELQVLVRTGLFTEEELSSIIAAEYRTGFVAFHHDGVTPATPPLHFTGVLDLAVHADTLLSLCRAAIELSGTDSLLLEGWELESLSNDDQASVVLHRDGERRRYTAPLLIDALGSGSPIARALNRGRGPTHVCPTVGTVAEGFVQGSAPDEVDPEVGEILVTTTHAQKNRQLIWEGFPGANGAFTSYLFFYDALRSATNKSLLDLYEEYFTQLDSYKKRTPEFRILKPTFGYIPAVHHRYPWKTRRTATDHVLCIGDAAALSSPLTYCGFGSFVRTLPRTTALVEHALADRLLSRRDLSRIHAFEPNVAVTSGFSRFLIQGARHAPHQVNASLNMILDVLLHLDEHIRVELFRDALRFSSYNTLMSTVPRLYPGALGLIFRVLGVGGALHWVLAFLGFAWHERKRRRFLARKHCDAFSQTHPRDRFSARVAAFTYIGNDPSM